MISSPGVGLLTIEVSARVEGHHQKQRMLNRTCRTLEYFVLLTDEEFQMLAVQCQELCAVGAMPIIVPRFQ